MAYLTWSDATERVAKGLHSYDWDLEVVVEAGSAEDVPIDIEGKEDGDEWLLEWSFDVSGGDVEFGVEVDGEVALDLTTLRSETKDGVAEGRVMIDSRAKALMLVFENQRNFWFSSATKRIMGVVKIVRREVGGERGGGGGGGLALSSSRRQFPARRRVRKKSKEEWPRAPHSSEHRMPRSVAVGGGRGGGGRKRGANTERSRRSSASFTTSESGSGSSSESSREEETQTSVTSATSGGTEAGVLATPEDYTEELEYMEAMLRFKEERHVKHAAAPPRGGTRGRAARGKAKEKEAPSKPKLLRPKPNPPKARIRGQRQRKREAGRGSSRSTSGGGGSTEQRGVSGSAKEQALQRRCNELLAQVRDLSKFLARVEDDEQGIAAQLERKLVEERAKNSAAAAKCSVLEQDLELATTVSAKWRERCDRQRAALREVSEEKSEALAAAAARIDQASVSESKRDAARYDALQEKQRELHLESTRQSEEIERLRAALAETDPATTDALKLKALHLEADNERLTAALQQSSADCGDGSAAGRGAVDAGRSESDAVRVLRATVRSHREQLAAAQCAAEEARADAAAARSASSELPDVESGATALIDVDSALAIVCQEQEVQIATLELELRRMVARDVHR